MLPDQFGDVDAGEDVAVEHQHRVVRAGRQLLCRVADRAAGAQRFGLGDVDQVESELPLSVPEVLLEDLGEVGGGQDDAGDPGRGRTRDLVGQKGHARGAHHRLRGVRGQRTQPGALAADKKDCFAHEWLYAFISGRGQEGDRGRTVGDCGGIVRAGPIRPSPPRGPSADRSRTVCGPCARCSVAVPPVRQGPAGSGRVNASERGTELCGGTFCMISV